MADSSIQTSKLQTALSKVKFESDTALRNYFTTGDREMLGEYRAYIRAMEIIRKEVK